MKGHRHPLSHIMSEVNAIFSELGFVFAEGPEM
jgi:phenylalanyl-tRNA synthetase alpha subunit